MNKQEFIEKAIKVHGNKYNYDQVVYGKSNKEKVKIRCNTCGKDFFQSPNSHLSNHGCPYCTKKRKLTKELFIELATQVHGDKYDYSEVEICGNKKNVKIKCKACNKAFFQIPTNHIYLKQECPYCSEHRSKKYTLEEFIEKAKKIHGDKYDYSKVVYISMDDKIKIYCKKCKKYFYQKPAAHIQKQGCPYCKRLTNEELIEKFVRVHGNKYDYSKVNYITKNEKVEIICPKHGSFWQRPSSHAEGCGCPQCRSSKGERAISMYLSKNKVKYIHQKKFKDCKDKNLLPFDFYLPEYNLCIEYQGKHHYELVARTPHESDEMSNNRFKEIKHHDKIKKNYCINNKINFLEITYKQDIETTLDKWFSSNGN